MTIEKALVNPYAAINKPDSGELVKPDEENIKEKKPFYCPDIRCKDPNRELLHRSLKGDGRDHFYHRPKYQHEFAGETLLHIEAIKYFQSLESFELPPEKSGGVPNKIQLDKSRTEIEYNWIKNLRPDVKIVSVDGEEYFIEIFVTHETRGEKLKLLKKHEKPTIEIDLEEFYYLNEEDCKSNLDFVRENVPEQIGELSFKKWLVKPNTDSSDSLTTGEKVGCAAVIAILILFIDRFRKKL